MQDKTQNHFSLKKRLQSFKFAFNGLILLFRSEHNARIHFVAAIIAITAGYLLHISHWEWMAIFLSIALVFITELINSSIEHFADKVSPQQDGTIGKAKDLAAAAVLVAAIFSILV